LLAAGWLSSLQARFGAMAALIPNGSNFRLFGPAHLLILISVPVLGLVLAKWCGKGPGAARMVRYAVAFFLSVNELVWYTYRLHLPLRASEAPMRQPSWKKS
jgi:hypothetical protein